MCLFHRILLLDWNSIDKSHDIFVLIYIFLYEKILETIIPHICIPAQNTFVPVFNLDFLIDDGK